MVTAAANKANAGHVVEREVILEIKINKEIRDYTESVFFGLSPRQFFFSLAAVGVAVGLFFILRKHFSTETVSWMCILGAAPFAALGFIRYHGMSAEQFLWAWIRSELLEPKRLTASRTTNIYHELMKDSIERRVSTEPVEGEEKIDVEDISDNTETDT